MKDRHPVTFSQLRVANLGRCLEVFHPLEDWSPTDWATAVSGEVGEACRPEVSAGPAAQTFPLRA